MQRRLDPDERYGLRLSLIALATLLLALPFSYLVLEVTRDGPLTDLDRKVAETVHDEIVGENDEIFFLKVITNLGSPITLYVLLGMGVIYLVRQGHRRTALYLAITPQIGGLISLAVKATVGRARPDPGESIAEALGKSFPSGHALNTTVAYGALLLAFMPYIQRRWRPWCIAGYIALVTAVGASRIGLVVHYVSDVLAGYFLGFAWLAVATAAFSIWREERGRKPVEVIEGAAPEIAEEDSRPGSSA
jgi:undecaprenyl-diphosphatase